MDQQRPDFPDEREHQRQRAFMEAVATSRDQFREGSRADVNELNRRNRELLAANVKLRAENDDLRQRLASARP